MLYGDMLRNIINIFRRKKYRNKKEILKYLSEGIFKFDNDVLYEVLIIIIKQDLPFRRALYTFEKLYDVIVYTKEDIDLFLKAASITKKIDKNISIEVASYLKNFYICFKNKKLAIDIYRHFSVLDEYTDARSISSYIKNARKYYIDEKAFYYSIINLIDAISKDSSAKKDIINNQLNEDKKIAGSYNYNLNRIEYYNNVVDEIEKNAEERKAKQNQIRNKFEAISKIETKEEKNIENLSIRIPSQDEISYLENSKTSDEKTSAFNLVLAKIKQEIGKSGYLLVNTYDTDFKFKNAIYNFIFSDKKEKITKVLLQENIRKYLGLYYFSIYNDTLSIFHKLIGEVPVQDLALYNFEKKVVEVFNDEPEIYIEIVTKNNNMLKSFKNANDISTLREIVKVNTSFLNFKIKDEELFHSRIKSILKYFSIEMVANSLETEFIKYIESDLESKVIKKLVDTNPIFYESFDNLNYIFLDIFSNEELASLDKEQIVETINIFIERTRRRSSRSLSKAERLVIEKIIVNKLKYKYIIWIILGIDSPSTINLKLDTYLLINAEEENQLISAYEDYFHKFPSIIKFNKMRRLVKEIESSYKKEET